MKVKEPAFYQNIYENNKGFYYCNYEIFTSSVKDELPFDLVSDFKTEPRLVSTLFYL
jgi:hypothetical protein